METRQNETKLYNLLARVLEVSVENINDQSSPDNIENWDSFNGLMIATDLEKEFDVHFSIEEVVSVKKVADIKQNLRNHAVKI